MAKVIYVRASSRAKSYVRGVKAAPGYGRKGSRISRALKASQRIGKRVASPSITPKRKAQLEKLRGRVRSIFSKR